ncbi:hypothetical protein B0T17DRAFT_589293 [Bombardia bombarda]|uniref:Rhodopsin domain-containing protein n=1 Tax=Bombardia bombarda TaxID=252184 RepID=A0AA39X932_9PEZI|nr:hypothetical protein B0T17DRAFT_589293 [Bombardia bombarda]
MADSSNVPAMMATMIVCIIASLVFMMLRFYCKQILSSSRLGLDDYVLVFSWILFLVFCILSMQAAQYGLGKHLVDIDLVNDFPKALFLIPIGQFFAVLSISVSKSSFILTLLRLVTKPYQKVALWFMLLTINGSMLMIAIVQFYQCGAVPTEGCIEGNTVIALGVFAAGYSAAMDIVLSAFPSLVIWNLQMKTREKVGVIVAMSLGLVAGVIGIYKSTTIPNVARDSDFTFGTAIVLIWLVAEFTATVMAASIPFFRPLVRKFSSKGTSRKESSGYGMTNRSRGHKQLGSQVDMKSSVGPDSDSSKGIVVSNNNILRKTDYVVEYDSASHDEEAGKPHREMF